VGTVKEKKMGSQDIALTKKKKGGRGKRQNRDLAEHKMKKEKKHRGVEGNTIHEGTCATD